MQPPPYASYQQGSSSSSSSTTSSTSGSQDAAPPAAASRASTPTPSKAELCSTKRPLTFWPLLALIYYTSSGGPFGIESIVANVGPLLGIVGYIVFPLVWSIPEALLTAELSSAFPECAGCVVWVNEAFGHPSWGYMRGALSWLSGVMDNSIYPVLFVDYAASIDARLGLPVPRAILVLSFTLTFTYLSYRGLDLAGRVAVGVCFACLMPFVVLCLLGLFQIDVTRAKGWRDDPATLTKADWLGMINVLFWNLNAFDSAASFAGEVRNPGYTYPRAMLVSIALIVVSYVLPITIGTLATDIPYAEWTDGTFTQVAREVGGRWLAVWLVLCAAVSNVGLFLAEMSSDAYQIMGMAEIGLLPAFLGRKSPYGTPTYPILISMVVVLCMGLSSSFEAIIVLVNYLYAIAEIFEIAAFLLLRVERPDLSRPYRIPVNTFGAFLMMLLPVAFIFIVLFTATLRTGLVSLSLAAGGVLSYFAMEWLKKHQVCAFNTFPPPAPVPMQDLEEEEEERNGNGQTESEENERTALTGSPHTVVV